MLKFSSLEGRVMEAVNHFKNSAMEADTISKHGRKSKGQTSRNNFLGIACFAVLLAAVALMGCGGGSGGGGSAKIKMTREDDGYVGFDLYGSGVATVDWGDGSEKVTLTLNEKGVRFEYSYPNATIRTISVNGDDITELRCYKQELTSLDVSKNKALTKLECYSNQFTSLDVSKNKALTRLGCYSNQLTSLDVSKNTVLTELSCYGNQLTSLDVSKNTALTKLDCYGNQLMSLDVSKNTALTKLDCGGNQLTSLDVSKNTAMTELSCSSNQLTNLDVSQNTALAILSCYGNQLTAVALNALFSTLHSNPGKSIEINNNPGTDTCDKSIAERKGWKLYY